MHNLNIDEILKFLNSSLNGLSEEEAKRRLEKYGSNEIKEEKENSLKIFLSQFKNPLVIILAITGSIAIFIGKFYESIIIFGLLIFNSIVGFYHEIKIRTKLESLKKLTETKCRVIRNGIEKEINSSEVVPGDIIILREGDIVPADARLIESINLEVNEAILTGESFPVEKNANVVLPVSTQLHERINCIYKGTSVLKGKGKAIVFATGKDTELGKISKNLQQKGPESPFFKSFSKFAKIWIIMNIIILSIILIVAISFYKLEADLMLLYVLSQLVSVIPAGLPIVVTLTLVIGAHHLANKKFYVKYLPTVETLGSVEYLIIDKTGTITKQELKVDEYFATNKKILFLCAALCNDSDGESGDIIDLEILKWLDEMKVDWRKIRKEYEKIWEHPFDPKKRFSAVIVKRNGKSYLFIKGAYESLKKLSKNVNKKLDKIHNDLTSKGLRVIALGYKKIDKITPNLENIKVKIVGFIGFLDPPKENIKKVIENVKKSGIKVIMITGDNILTAKYIARKTGILEENDYALEGKDLENLDNETLYDLLKKTSVIARATPDEKYRIVKLLESKGHIVGMLGDGVNDAPALKIAHVGISVENAAQITKDASKSIILSKDLSVVIDGIFEGRKISRNISGVIRYLLSTNMFEVLFNALSILSGLKLPVYPSQILWINLVTDGVQDKAYPFTRQGEDVLKNKPINPSELFIGKKQIILILLNALFLAITHYFLYLHLLKIFPFEIVNSIIFTSMAISQWSVGIQELSNEPFFKNPLQYIRKNKYIYVGILIGFLLQLTAIYFLNDFFKTIPLAMEHWKYIIIIPVLTFFFIELRKIIENLIIKQ